MKKILSLLALVLFSCMGAWAQGTVTGAKGTIYTSPALVDGNFANGTRFYTIAINRNNCMLDSRYLPTVKEKKANACDENKWAVLSAEGGYQFINKATKKVLTFAGTSNDAAASLTDNFDDTNSVFEFTTSQNSSFQSGHEVFRIVGTENAYPNDKNSGLAIWVSSYALWGWGASATNPGAGDQGSQFKFTEVEVLNNVVLESLALNVENLVMNIGQVQDLTVTATPVDATKEVTLTSSNAGVACIVDGKIQAISEGTATITATSVKFPTVSTTCDVTVQKPDWYVHVSPELGKSANDRVVSTITLNGTNITVPAYSYPYVDLTSEKFTVEAGASVQVGMTNIGWMHSMYYLNQNDDNQFTEDEMVTHSTLTGGNGTNSGIAAFTAPSTAGTYRMRFKTDWHGNNANGNDPAGRIADDGTLTGTNSIWINRGVIIDVMLEVTAPEVTPVTPVEYVTSLNDKYTYAIVNIQPTKATYYLKNDNGTLAAPSITGITADTEWAEDAQFVAELQSDGVFAFKNVANGQYLAWRGANGGANDNKGFVAEVNDYSSWTMHAGTRYPDTNTFWFVAKRGNNNDGTLILSNAGEWNAWGATENTTNEGFSNNYGFVLVKEYVAPEFDAAKKYTIDNVADKRGKLAYNPAGESFVGLADVTLAPNYASLHASSTNPEVGIEWQLTQVGADKVNLKNLKNDKYAVIQSNGKCVWGDTPYEYVFTKYEGYYTLQGNGTPSSNLLTAACGWNANQGPVYLEGTTVKNEHKFVITEVEEPVAPSYTEEEIAALQEEIDGLKLGLVGYPDAYSDEAVAVMAYHGIFGDGVTAETYEAAQAALTALYNCTDVVLPEADKYYEIKAVYHDGAKQYLGFDGTKLSITDAKPVGGSVTFKAESVEGNNVVLSIDGHYVHWTSGDDKDKSADTDGLNDDLTAINTLTLSKATTGSSTPKATPENLFGRFQIQGNGTDGKKYYFVTRNDLAGVGNFVAAGASDKFFDDNWDHLGHNRTTYFEFVEVEAPAVDAPATAAEIESAADLLWRATAGFIGYPKADDPVVAALDAAVNKAGVTATELGAAVLAYKNCENVVLPAKNQFYQLQGSSTLTVIGGGTTGNAVKLDAEKFNQAPQEVDLSSIYYYSEEGYLINYNGGRALKGSAVAGVSETPDVYTFCHETLTEPGTLSIKNAAGKYLIDVHNILNTADAPVGAATNWNVNAYGYAPIVVGSTGYATVYLPYTVAAAREYDIKAVYVVRNEGDILTTSKVTDIHCIPSKTAVIVEAEPNSRCFGKGMGGEEWYPESPEVEAAVRDNALQGTLIAMPKPDNALVFNVKDDVPGFYGFNGDVLAGFKAYYPYAGSAASNGIALRFDDTLTAIESAIETAKGHDVFDLQGRRVLNAKNGIFIQNGKKVVK